VANCHRYQRHRLQICHQCQRHRWQTMGTISVCRYLKVNLKVKFIYIFTLLSKGVPAKLLTFFWLKIFFICHAGVKDTGGELWAANISTNFLTKLKRL
jgi:hypothetical protein